MPMVKRISALFFPAILVAAVVMFCLNCGAHKSGANGQDFTYSNPIVDRYLADPFILHRPPWYYMYSTGRALDGRFIQIYRSTDLVTWELVRGAVTRGGENAWNRKNFWAPEVMEIDGLYHLYYTASTEGTPANTGNRVGLAVSDSPGGPFRPPPTLYAHHMGDRSSREPDSEKSSLPVLFQLNSAGPRDIYTPIWRRSRSCPCSTTRTWGCGSSIQFSPGRDTGWFGSVSKLRWRSETLPRRIR